MKLTFLGYIYIVLGIILLITSIARENITLFMLSAILFMIVLIERIRFRDLVANIHKSIDVWRDFERRICEEGEDIGVSIYIYNKSKIPIALLRIEDSIPRYTKVIKGSPSSYTALAPQSYVRIDYKLKFFRPGRHSFEEIHVSFRDLLQIYEYTTTFRIHDEITVIPRALEVREVFKALATLPGAGIRGLSKSGMYDIVNIRDYVPGDDARKILWKIYARTSKLMVREDLGETVPRTLVIVDINRNQWYIGEESNTLAEKQLRVTRYIIDILLKSYSVIDVLICSDEAVPKFVSEISLDRSELLYKVFEAITPGIGGCKKSFSEISSIIKYLGLEIEKYSLVLFITNPISIATSTPSDVEEILRDLGRNVAVIIVSDEQILELHRDIIYAIHGVIDMVEAIGGKGIVLKV